MAMTSDLADSKNFEDESEDLYRELMDEHEQSFRSLDRASTLLEESLLDMANDSSLALH